MDIGIGELRDGLILYIILISSLCIHEWAHAAAADRLGDYTPRSQGRVTLNPAAHMDLFGSVIFPLVCIFLIPGNFLFGWGKPVMINPSNFARRVRDDILTTLAGPFSNLGLALLAAVVGGFAYRADPNTVELFHRVIFLNVALAVFNLIPLPPLDGGQVMKHIVRMSEETFYNLSRWSFLILIIAINLPPVRFLLVQVILIVAWPFMAIYQIIA